MVASEPLSMLLIEAVDFIDRPSSSIIALISRQMPSLQVMEKTTYIIIYTVLYLLAPVLFFLYVVAPHRFFLPKFSLPRDRFKFRLSPTSKRRHSIVSYFDAVMGKPLAPDSVLSGSDDFENRNELYRKRRDDFRDNPAALAELVQWKAQNNGYTYKVL